MGVAAGLLWEYLFVFVIMLAPVSPRGTRRSSGLVLRSFMLFFFGQPEGIRGSSGAPHGACAIAASRRTHAFQLSWVVGLPEGISGSSGAPDGAKSLGTTSGFCESICLCLSSCCLWYHPGAFVGLVVYARP